MNRELFDSWLPKIETVYNELQELILTNLVMINEQPAPTFEEARRSKIFCERLSTASNLMQCGMDEQDNAVGILPGKADQGSSLSLVNAAIHSQVRLRVKESGR